eukprot:scaffold46520_cov69-Phaeocystis_antarctica.AAC.2
MGLRACVARSTRAVRSRRAARGHRRGRRGRRGSGQRRPPLRPTSRLAPPRCQPAAPAGRDGARGAR